MSDSIDKKPTYKKFTLKKVSSEHLVQHKAYSINYSAELNSEQHAAVMHAEGPCLVIAGAGTGKTRTLTFRVARLIEDGIHPASILLLTFTRKSASEMLRRASALLDGRCNDVVGGTFHSFAHSVLRRYAVLAGLTPSFSILDQSDAEDVVNLVRSDYLQADKKRRFPQKSTILSIHSASVNKQSSVAEVIKSEYPQYTDEIESIQTVIAAYGAYKYKHNLVDYDDLLLYLLELLRSHRNVREELNRRHLYVMVDEYQDTNLIQHSIVLHLGGPKRNILAVGDDAQGIYSFRGAHHRNILDFPKSFDDCSVITLEQNYRSTQEILRFTNEVISRSAERFDKKLHSHRFGGDLPAILNTGNENTQSEFVASRIVELREEGIPLEDMAVLFRSGFHSYDLELELQRRNIPFRKFGGFKFIETSHVKDILAHLRVLSNPTDAVSWNRILLLIEGIGTKTAREIIDVITAGGGSKAFAMPSFTSSKAAKAGPLFDLLGKLHKAKSTLQEIVAEIIEYYRPMMKRTYDDFKKREKDVDSLSQLVERYSSISQLLNEMAMDPPAESITDISPTDKEEEFLTLSTIHSAKGLEWRVVFVLWALEGRFPPARAMESTESVEEERRLMYVACTRAKDYLYLTYPVNIFDKETGMVLSMPSQFIAQIPDELADHYIIAPE